MADRKIRYELSTIGQYVSDQGSAIPLNPVLSPPGDLTEAQIDAVLAAINATRRTETAPCGERVGIKPRKLRFTRSNGNTMSIIAPIRSDIIDVATTIRDILNATAFNVICIELIGEHSLNLIEELAPPSKGAPVITRPIKPSDSSGKHKSVYTSAMREYSADTPFGANILMPFRSETDSEGEAPYSNLSDYFASCVDPVIEVACGGSTSIDYRRYIPSFLTDNDGTIALQTVTAPVKVSDATQISNCGEILAANLSVICLEYCGESNSRIHKLLP